MKKILITGGAGFVGVNLVRRLIRDSEFSITVMDNLSKGNLSLLQKIAHKEGCNQLRFCKEDIRDSKAVNRIMAGHHLVAHLAAQTGVIPSLSDPLKDADVNINGTLNLLSAAKENGIQRFIFASSAAPLGEQTPPLDESKVPAPRSPYGASKLAGEAYCSAFHHSFGLETAVLRFSNLYGPNSFHKGSVIALFIKQILRGEPLTIYGDGNQTRDFLYVEDITQVILALLQKDLNGEIFQVGTGRETSVNTLIDLLKEVTGMKPEIRLQPERKGEVIRNYTSVKKLERFIGFQPHTSLSEGLKHTWEWFKTNYESR